MHEIIKNNRLFQNLSAEDTEYALRFFDARTEKYKKGSCYKKPFCLMERFGLVLSGNLQVYMDEPDGSRLVMASLGPGMSFGESMCFLKRDEPVCVYVTSDSEILTMSCDALRKPSSDRRDAELSARFTAMIAARTLAMNRRIQVLSKLTIREKLLAFFTGLPGASSGKPVELTMNREDMAAYLGTNRSALSRELSRLKAEGKIDFYRNTFRLLL